MLFPWKESILVFLLIALNISFNSLHFKSRYNQLIGEYPQIRFFIIFATAMTVFSLDVSGKYPLSVRLLTATVIALIVQQMIEYNL